MTHSCIGRQKHLKTPERIRGVRKKCVGEHFIIEITAFPTSENTFLFQEKASQNYPASNYEIKLRK